MINLVTKLLAIDIVLEFGRVTNLVYGQALKTSGDEMCIRDRLEIIYVKQGRLPGDTTNASFDEAPHKKTLSSAVA